ncbi:MAG TPA: hypothetical protein VGR35_11320 [Tepidisphaeraceae bacterium]|nr:hypothetical protein [Tepidisphaeraceae bacterium]
MALQLAQLIVEGHEQAHRSAAVGVEQMTISVEGGLAAAVAHVRLDGLQIGAGGEQVRAAGVTDPVKVELPVPGLVLYARGLQIGSQHARLIGRELHERRIGGLAAGRPEQLSDEQWRQLNEPLATCFVDVGR